MSQAKASTWPPQTQGDQKPPAHPQSILTEFKLRPLDRLKIDEDEIEAIANNLFDGLVHFAGSLRVDAIIEGRLSKLLKERNKTFRDVIEAYKTAYYTFPDEWERSPPEKRDDMIYLFGFITTQLLKEADAKLIEIEEKKSAPLDAFDLKILLLALVFSELAIISGFYSVNTQILQYSTHPEISVDSTVGRSREILFESLKGGIREPVKLHLSRIEKICNIIDSTVKENRAILVDVYPFYSICHDEIKRMAKQSNIFFKKFAEIDFEFDEAFGGMTVSELQAMRKKVTEDIAKKMSDHFSNLDVLGGNVVIRADQVQSKQVKIFLNRVESILSNEENSRKNASCASFINLIHNSNHFLGNYFGLLIQAVYIDVLQNSDLQEKKNYLEVLARLMSMLDLFYDEKAVRKEDCSDEMAFYTLLGTLSQLSSAKEGAWLARTKETIESTKKLLDQKESERKHEDERKDAKKKEAKGDDAKEKKEKGEKTDDKKVMAAQSTATVTTPPSHQLPQSPTSHQNFGSSSSGASLTSLGPGSLPSSSAVSHSSSRLTLSGQKVGEKTDDKKVVALQPSVLAATPPVAKAEEKKDIKKEAPKVEKKSEAKEEFSEEEAAAAYDKSSEEVQTAAVYYQNDVCRAIDQRHIDKNLLVPNENTTLSEFFTNLKMYYNYPALSGILRDKTSTKYLGLYHLYADLKQKLYPTPSESSAEAQHQRSQSSFS